MLVSSDGQIVAVNEMLYALTDRSENEVLGLALKTLWSEIGDIIVPGANIQVGGQRKDGSEYVLALEIHRLSDVDAGSSWLITVENVTEIAQANAELQRMAFRDPLTGLNNRRYFSELLERTLRFTSRRNEICALLYLDLNNFKDVNDALGHAVGDELLKHIARRLLTSVRDTDEIARLGGDEFAVRWPRAPRPSLSRQPPSVSVMLSASRCNWPDAYCAPAPRSASPISRPMPPMPWSC